MYRRPPRPVAVPGVTDGTPGTDSFSGTPDRTTTPEARNGAKWVDGQDIGTWLDTANYVSPGARKEKLKDRRYRPARATRQRYAELHCASAFSFLGGASLPEDLVQRAAELELPAVALVDGNGVSGAPRFYKAAREAGIKALVGSEVRIAPGVLNSPLSGGPSSRTTDEAKLWPRLTLLVANRQGYKNLCRMLTAGALSRPKGEACVDEELLAAHAEGLYCLTGGEEGLIAQVLAREGHAATRQQLERLTDLFGGRISVEVQRHGLRREEERNQALVDLAGSLHIPLLATNGVRYARQTDKRLFDFLTCLQLPRLPPASRRDPELLPASPHLERRPGPLPPLHRPRPGADLKGAEDDREARARRLLPDRLGHHPLLPRAEQIMVQGRGLGRQQRRSATPCRSPPSTRSRWNCSSSASCPRSAASGRTSISTCPPATSARRSSSTSTNATVRTAPR